MVHVAVEIDRAQIAKSHVLLAGLAEAVDQLGTDRHFSSLNGVHHHDAQLPVQRVAPPHLLERDVGIKLIQPLLFIGIVWIEIQEVMSIGAEPVVVDLLQSANQLSLVRDQASRDELIRLLLKCTKGLVVSHTTSPSPEK